MFRTAQELDDFPKFLLGLINSRNIFEGDLELILCMDMSFVLSDVHEVHSCGAHLAGKIAPQQKYEAERKDPVQEEVPQDVAFDGYAILHTMFCEGACKISVMNQRAYSIQFPAFLDRLEILFSSSGLTLRERRKRLASVQAVPCLFNGLLCGGCLGDDHIDSGLAEGVSGALVSDIIRGNQRIDVLRDEPVGDFDAPTLWFL